MKSPATLKAELINAIANINSVIKYLKGKSAESTAGIGAECEKTAVKLQSIVESHQLPDAYKVAVVGRFKAGKSSFVNELLEIKLAGEDTSPETAAVTTFTHGSEVEARISLIDKDIWREQKKLYQEDPKNVDAHRAKMWDSFSKPKKNADGVEEKFDLDQIEHEFLEKGTGEIVIRLESSDGKSAAKIFRERLKTYTSGSKPYHCLVSSIHITTPSAILKDGIELIDTPGLGDTERFRVNLTEQAVENIDAILLLTKSGMAYGQEEKDFLISILRKGRIKQLIIVITQVDQTYEQYVKAMKADDEKPESISHRVKLERRRIMAEIKTTLEELSGSESSVTRSYLEQFGNVDIVFTSVHAHRDFKSGDAPTVVLAQGDPGGLLDFRNNLLDVLSTESRFSLAAGQILGQAKEALESLADVMQDKAAAIKNSKNGEEVERRLSSFRAEFEKICEGVAKELEETFNTFKASTEMRLEHHKTLIANIVMRAEKELNRFRTSDVGKHWRTRRGSNWGYMFELQSKVANRIFPSVQEMLESHVEDFSKYVRRHDRRILRLTRDAESAALSLELGRFSGFDIKKRLGETTSKVLERTQEQIVQEQEQIIKLLDQFVDGEVEEKISEKRKVVADIWGRGTSIAQQEVVNNFYDSIEEILSTALSSHISKRNATFAASLLRSAEHAPRDTFQEINDQLEVEIANLRQAAELALNGQRDHAERLIDNVLQKAHGAAANFQEIIEQLFNGRARRDLEEESLDIGASAVSSDEASFTDGDWAEQLGKACKTVFAAHSLKEGEQGWPFSRIFESIIFRGAEKIRVVDPYLFKTHQIRNLKELLLVVVDSATPKLIEVLTLPTPLEHRDFFNKSFEILSKEMFTDHGVTLEVRFVEALHDRFVFSDAGFVVKLGRGLDVYKPSTGLAAHRQESRRVRGCDVTVLQSGSPSD